MRSRIRNVLRGSLVLLVLAIAAVLLGLVPIRLDPFADAIAERVFEATGLDLTMGGPASLRLGPRARLSASHGSIATPDGARLLEVGEAHVRISLLGLVRGQVHIPEADIIALRYDYCRPLPERPTTPAPEDRPLPSIAVDDLRAADVTVTCNGEPVPLVVQQLTFAAPREGAMHLAVAAELAGAPASLMMSGGSLDTLLSGSPFVADALLKTEHATAIVDAEYTQVQQRPVVAARTELAIADAVALGEAFDFAVPPIGAVDVSGALHIDGDGIEFDDVAGAVGQTQFSGNGSLDLSQSRIKLSLDVSVETLDLAPFFGEASASDDDPTDIAPLLDVLRNFDAETSIRAERVAGLPLDIRSASVGARLVDGVVELDSANAELLDGLLAASGTFDAGPGCPPLRLQAAFESPSLDRVLEAGSINAPVSGQVERIDVGLESCGTSLESHIKSLDAGIKASAGALVVSGSVPVDLGSLEIDVAPGERLRASASASVDGKQVRADAIAGTLPELLGAESWPVRIDMQTAGSSLTLDGNVQSPAGRYSFTGKSALNAPNISTMRDWLGIAVEANVALVATSRLALDASRIAADDLRIELGRSDLSGAAAWRYAEEPSTLTLKLHSKFVDLDEIGSLIDIAPADGRPMAGDAVNQKVGAALPPVDLDLFFDIISDGPLDIEDLAINGSMRAGFINDARVSAIIGDELNLDGKLDFDARQLPATLALDVEADGANLGRVLSKLEVVEDLAMRADSIRFRIESSGMSHGDALSNSSLRADASGFEWVIPRTQSDKDFALLLKTVTLSMQPGQPLVATTYGSIDNSPVEFHMELPGLGTLLGDAETLPMRIVAGLDTDVAVIDAELGRLADGAISGQIELSGQAADTERPVLSELSPPLADYVVSAELDANAEAVSLANIKARLGGSTASGSASVSLDARPRLDMVIQSPKFQATDLALLPGFVRNNGDTDAGITDSPDPEIIESDAETRGPLVILNDLVAQYQERFDLNLRAAIDELHAGPDFLGGAEVELTIDESELRLQPVRLQLPGGDMNLTYTWRRVGDRMTSELTAVAGRFDYGGLVRLVDPASEARGIAYIDVDLTANADWSPDVPEFELLLANATGTIDFAAWPEDFQSGVFDLWTANLVFALLPSPSDEKPSRLNCVAARLKADAGVLETKNVLLDSTATIIRGRGKFDLAQREISLLVTPQAKRERFFSASTPVRVTGPLNDFQIGVEPAGFIGTLIRWYTNLIYVPFKWLTGQRFPPDGTQTCFDVMDWKLTPGLEMYFLERDFSAPPPAE